MSAQAVPAKENYFIGLTQFGTNICSGNAIIIRRSDGSSIVIKDGEAEFAIAPILSFKSSFSLNGVKIFYVCEIIPKVVPGIADKKFLRELPKELRTKIRNKMQRSAKRLVYEQQRERVITFEVAHNELEYTCLIGLTDK